MQEYTVQTKGINDNLHQVKDKIGMNRVSSIGSAESMAGQ